MSDDFILEVGKTYYPRKQDLFVSDTLVRGPGWQVERSQKEIIFSFLASGHGGGEVTYVISEEHFLLLKQRQINFQDLINKYEVN